MSSETQQRIRGEAIVELETQVYCACCEQWKFSLPSKIYGLILVPEAVLTCDKELFP